MVYLAKDTKTKTLQETRCTPAEFVAMLSPHVLDRYQHSMRYFGLLAPRKKGLTSAAVFALLGQHPRSSPRVSAGVIRSSSTLGLTRSSMNSAILCIG